MSFRTKLIRLRGFDEVLGRYGLFEDTDAGFNVMRTHLLVGARNAKIYHHKAANARDSGRRMGVMQILNRAYVTVKHSIPSKLPASQLRRFSAYKVIQYATDPFEVWSRTVLGRYVGL